MLIDFGVVIRHSRENVTERMNVSHPRVFSLFIFRRLIFRYSEEVNELALQIKQKTPTTFLVPSFHYICVVWIAQGL